jgi:hypothetical protein
MKPHDQSRYVEQYRRMLRARDQLASLADHLHRDGGSESDRLVYEDTAICFFQHAWHLTYWIENDAAVPQPLRDSALSRIKADEVLQVCEAVANGTKHLGRDRRGMGAVLERPGPDNPDAGEPDWELYVTLPGGHRRDVPTAANVIVTVWDGILRRENLLVGHAAKATF